jgi:hypothetical protein
MGCREGEGLIRNIGTCSPKYMAPYSRTALLKAYVLSFLRKNKIYRNPYNVRGPGSAVGIATSYGLDSPGIESRWVTRFYAPVQTGAGDHPDSCTMGTGSFLEVKSGRSVTMTPHPF